MEKFIVANWKANLSYPQAEKWLSVLSTSYRQAKDLRVVLAVPSLFLSSLQKQFGDFQGVFWAAQDVSSFPLGNYTGSIPASWLRDYVDYVIIGHRERRKYFRETIQDVANKVSESLEEDIRPILCVDMDNARQQAASIDSGDLERLIVAYTPSDSEQLEISRDVAGVVEGVEKIESLFPGAPVLYGGGVNEGNIKELLSLPQLFGIMAAGGCLDPQAFNRLLVKAGELVDR